MRKVLRTWANLAQTLDLGQYSFHPCGTWFPVFHEAFHRLSLPKVAPTFPWCTQFWRPDLVSCSEGKEKYAKLWNYLLLTFKLNFKLYVKITGVSFIVASVSLACLLPGIKLNAREEGRGEKWVLLVHVKNDHYANDLSFRRFWNNEITIIRSDQVIQLKGF